MSILSVFRLRQRLGGRTGIWGQWHMRIINWITTSLTVLPWYHNIYSYIDCLLFCRINVDIVIMLNKESNLIYIASSVPEWLPHFKKIPIGLSWFLFCASFACGIFHTYLSAEHAVIQGAPKFPTMSPNGSKYDFQLYKSSQKHWFYREGNMHWLFLFGG